MKRITKLQLTELIRSVVQEQSATGGGATFVAGAGMQHTGPIRKKHKKSKKK